MGNSCIKKDEKLIEKKPINDCYYLKLIKDNNKNIIKFGYIDVKLEFSDHLCIYNTDTNKLIYEISYYDITSWLHGKVQFGINYKNYDNVTFQLVFSVKNSDIICNSIKKRVNELLELNNRSKDMYEQ
jgi:hypothetical protein